MPAKCHECGSTDWTDDGVCRTCRSFPSLGWQVADLIETVCAIPDRERAGDPFMVTDEQLRTLVHHYRVHPISGELVYFRGTQLTRPQKWGKGPFSAAVICAEAHPDGPVLPDGWDTDGQPVGRPWATPHVQVTAVSENQTGNVFRALLPMIQLGALAADMPDTGLTRINLPGGGLIEPVTAGALSRLGQRVTFVVQDQTESWFKSNHGHDLADNQRRGLAGMGGRWLSTPNAWDPARDSVAQRTAEASPSGVFLDDADPGPGSVRNRADRRRMLKRVYGDSATKPRGDAEWEPWIKLDRIDGEIEALIEQGDPAQAERWFLNRKLAAEQAAFDIVRWRQLARPETKIDEHSTIVLGIDGARFKDAVGAVATDVKTGFQWVVTVVEAPDNPPEGYEHDLRIVDGAVSDIFERFNVWRAYTDPHYIQHLVEGWQNRYGDRRVIEWYTNRHKPVGWAVRNFTQAIEAGDLTHDGNQVFDRHIGNARRMELTVKDNEGLSLHSISKEGARSPLKMDLAMAAVLSWEARGDAIAAGAVSLNEPETQPETGNTENVWVPGKAPSMRQILDEYDSEGPMGQFS